MIPKTIELVRQPSHNTCSHACLAMVTGRPVEEIVAELPAPCGPWEYNAWLVRHGIRPTDPTDVFFRGEVYLLTVASRNLLGKLHLVVLDLREDGEAGGAKLFDPVDGVEGKTANTIDEYNDGKVPWACASRLVDCSR